MTNQQRVGDLQINQDLAYQRREWVFQRVGWVSNNGFLKWKES